MLNSFIKKIEYIRNLPCEQEDPNEQNPIDQISEKIKKDFTEESSKDDKIHSVINEIRKGMDVDSLLKSVDSKGSFTETQRSLAFDFELHLKVMAIKIIHDWSNSNRMYDRVFEAYHSIGSTNPCGIRKQTDICTPASHFLFEAKNLYINGGYSHNARLNLNIKELAFLDYILSEWKLPTVKEIKKDYKTPGMLHHGAFNTLTEKDLKRKSEIKKI